MPLIEPTSAEPSMEKGFANQRVVLVFRKDILPISETFIRDQVASYKRWRPILCGYRRVPGLNMDGIAPVLLEPNGESVAATFRLKLAQHGQYFGIHSGRLKALVAGIKPNIIHAHFGYDGVLVYDIACQLGIPLVVTLHGTDVLTSDSAWQSGRKGWFFKRYPEKLRRMFEDPRVNFIAVSEALRKAAIGRGAPQERTFLAYTGVDTEVFKPQGSVVEHRDGVLFVGRLVTFKGCEYLLRALAEVRKHRSQCRLIIIGDGPLRASLESLAGRLGVNAEFRGAQAGEAIRNAMNHAQLLCLPSLADADGCFEAFGMVLLEAQAMGLPVVTSARGGREGVIDGETGRVVPEADSEELARTILELLSNPASLEQMGVTARNHTIRNFDIRRCTKRLEDLYTQLVEHAL